MKAMEKQVNNDQRLACQGPGQIAKFFEMGPGPSTCSSTSLSVAWRVRINFQLTHHLEISKGTFKSSIWHHGPHLILGCHGRTC